MFIHKYGLDRVFMNYVTIFFSKITVERNFPLFLMPRDIFISQLNDTTERKILK